ncbi:MAG: hypothetical protein IJZ55_10225 [Lachnospiraceae bacterium]|nr:hypothetical protein [Lachnospiraceae bacterium]
MNGIHRFGGFPKNVNEILNGGNREERRAAGKAKRPGNDNAAMYEMSDKAKKMDKDELKAYQKNAGGIHLEEKKKVEDEVELSEAAKNLLAELKEKYGDIDFFVAEFSNDEEAQYYHNQSTKKYSCVIDPKTLEEMAADEAVKEKYVGIIDTADEKFDQVKEELGEDADQIKRMGITVDKDGVVTYFAELTKQTLRMQEDLRNEQKAIRAEKKERNEKLERQREEKRAERDEKNETVADKNGNDKDKPVIPNKVTAGSIEELTAKLKELLAERAAGNAEKEDTAKEDVKQERPHFDMTL